MNGTYSYTKIRSETLNELRSLGSTKSECRNALNIIYKECERLEAIALKHNAFHIASLLKSFMRIVFSWIVDETANYHVHSAISRLHSICMTPTNNTTVFCASNLLPL